MHSYQNQELTIINNLFASSEQYSKQVKAYLLEVHKNNQQIIENLIQASSKVLSQQQFTPINKLQAIRLIKDMMNQNNFYVVKQVKLHILHLIIEVSKFEKGNPKENRGANYFQAYGNDNKIKTVANSFYRLNLECIQAWAIYYPNDNEFTQAYAILIQESVFFPDIFTYFKSNELKERKLVIPEGESLPIKQEPQLIKKLKEQLKGLQNQKDLVVSIMNTDNQDSIQWDMVQEIVNMFQIFTNELPKYLDQLFNLDEAYQSQYFNPLCEEQELLNQFLLATYELKQKKLPFQEYKEKYILSGKLSALATQTQQTPGQQCIADQPEEQREQELKKNELEDLKQVEDVKEIPPSMPSSSTHQQKLEIVQQQQQIVEVSQEIESEEKQLEIQILECLSQMEKYKDFYQSTVGRIISDQNEQQCTIFINLLNKNLYSLEELPDKKSEYFYLLAIRLIKDIIGSETQKNENTDELGVFTKCFLSSDLIQKLKIYVRYNKSSPNMNRGSSILGENKNSKVANSFFVCLLECFMGWAIIYPQTNFWELFEEMLKEGVTFPDKFQYFSSHRIKFSKYHQELNKRAEEQILLFTNAIDVNQNWSDDLARQLDYHIEKLHTQIIQIKKLTSWYKATSQPHDSDIQSLEQLEERISNYCISYEKLEENNFKDYAQFHKQFTIKTIQQNFDQLKEHIEPEVIVGQSTYIDSKQNWLLQSLNDPQRNIASKELFAEIKRPSEHQQRNFINNKLLSQQMYEENLENVINSVKMMQLNSSNIIVQSALMLIKNPEYDLPDFIMARYNSVLLINRLSEEQFQSLEFIEQINNQFIKELVNYLLQLLTIKKKQENLSYWMFQLDILQQKLLYQYILQSFQLCQNLETNYQQYQNFATESLRLFSFINEFDEYFQPKQIEINETLENTIAYITKVKNELQYQLNTILQKVQQCDDPETFDNDSTLNQELNTLQQMNLEIDKNLQDDQEALNKIKQSKEENYNELVEQQTNIKKIKNIYLNYQKKVIKFKQFKQFLLKFGSSQPSQRPSEAPVIIQEKILTEIQDFQGRQQVDVSQVQIQMKEIQEEVFQDQQLEFKFEKTQQTIQHKNIRNDEYEEMHQLQNKSQNKQQLDHQDFGLELTQQTMKRTNLRNNNLQNYEEMHEIKQQLEPTYNFQQEFVQDKLQSPIQSKKESRAGPTFQALFEENDPTLNIINYKMSTVPPKMHDNNNNKFQSISPQANKSFASIEVERQAQDTQKQTLVVRENMILKLQLSQAEKYNLELEEKNKMLENQLQIQEERFKSVIQENEQLRKGQQSSSKIVSNINKEIEEVKNNYALNSQNYKDQNPQKNIQKYKDYSNPFNKEELLDF